MVYDGELIAEGELLRLTVLQVKSPGAYSPCSQPTGQRRAYQSLKRFLWNLESGFALVTTPTAVLEPEQSTVVEL